MYQEQTIANKQNAHRNIILQCKYARTWDRRGMRDGMVQIWVKFVRKKQGKKYDKH